LFSRRERGAIGQDDHPVTITAVAFRSAPALDAIREGAVTLPRPPVTSPIRDA
jgi:hypothetical protein